MGLEEIRIYNVGGTENDARFDYICGHCGHLVSGRVVAGYRKKANNGKGKNYSDIMFILCTSCAKGSVWLSDGTIIPGNSPAEALQGLTPEVNAAWEEARNCFAINAFTGCELLCRKILMSIGVDKGADEGKSFKYYINYIEQQKYITPPMKPWADRIRLNANDTTHKLAPPDRKHCEDTLMFTKQLLVLVYVMENEAKNYTQ
jgi:Domain of unknown function (DUF4145)